MTKLKILYIGETWNGSSARSLRDAFAAIDGIEIDDIGEDQYSPRARGLPVRLSNRLLGPLYRMEIFHEILRRVGAFQPHVVVVYKGNLIDSKTVDTLQQRGIPVANVFPDCSPHAFGPRLRKAIGKYDLVISTKPFHPDQWNSTYGYVNKCVCVPHGYDPKVHYWCEIAQDQDIDIVLAASWRPQYEALMAEVARLIPDKNISFALAGPGWVRRRSVFPQHWLFPGPLFGRAYGQFVRRGKIVIAPVHREVIIGGKKQPGDEDTTRTYELAASGTFFLHRRTPFASIVYEEGKESVFWDTAEELAYHIRYYLPFSNLRHEIAKAAHDRAVPDYSVPARASEILIHLRRLVE